MLTSVSLPDQGILALIGYGVVFAGLILLMIVVTIMGSAFIAKDKRAEKAHSHMTKGLNNIFPKKLLHNDGRLMEQGYRMTSGSPTKLVGSGLLSSAVMARFVCISDNGMQKFH
mgnify:CR=1 FL=1